MNHKDLIDQFYSAFAQGDIDRMIECYHPEVQFEDPAFGPLQGDRAKAMWKMLLSKGAGNTQIRFNEIDADEHTGKAHWMATYQYGPKKRKVVNDVKASFEFKDGKIIKHTDVFDIWKWSGQALGLPGRLLGWTPFMKNTIRKQANKTLDQYLAKNA